MKKILLAIALTLMIPGIAGCGSIQSYNLWLENRQRTFERQQAVLEAQNNVTVAHYQVLAALQQAQVNIAIAHGKAQAQEIQTRTLRPLFVEQELVDAINAGHVQTLVLPANAMLPLNLQGMVNSTPDDSNGN